MPYKGEIPITAYFSRVTSTPKNTQPRLKKRGVSEDDNVKGKAKQPASKKLKLKDEPAPSLGNRSPESFTEEIPASPDREPAAALHRVPPSLTRHDYPTSSTSTPVTDLKQLATRICTHISSPTPNVKEKRLFKPPSARIFASPTVINLVDSQEENEADQTASSRSSEEFVPSSQTQELDYDFASNSRSHGRQDSVQEPELLPKPSRDQVMSSGRQSSARKITFTDTLESIPPANTHEDYVDSSQSQPMDFRGSASPASLRSNSPFEHEIIPSSQSQWDPSIEVSEDLLADTTLVAQPVDESIPDDQSMRQSVSPLPWSSQTEPEDLEDVEPRSRSRSPLNPMEQVDLQEPQAPFNEDTPGSKPEYPPTEHTPSSPLGFTQNLPLSQDDAGYSQYDSGSSLPSVVQDFRDMFDDEGSYPSDFPMSLRL